MDQEPFTPRNAVVAYPASSRKVEKVREKCSQAMPKMGEGGMAVYHGEQLEAVNQGGEAEPFPPPGKTARS